MFRLCFHKWSDWSKPYYSEERRVRCGEVVTHTVAAQDRRCKKCGKLQARTFRDGVIKENPPT